MRRSRFWEQEPEYKKKQVIAEENRDRAKHHEENGRNIIAVAAAIDHVAAQQQAYRDQRAGHETHRGGRERITIAVIGVTALLALATIIVTHVDTMRVIKATRTAANEQHNDTVVALAKTDAAIAESRRLADAANKSANLAEAASRAWVAPIRFEFAHPNDATDPLKVHVVIQNVGREPARELTHKLGTAFIESPSLPVAQWGDLPEWASNASLEPRELCKSVESSTNYSVLYPSTIYTLTLDIPITSNPLPVQEIEAKQTVYFVGGCFSYISLGRRRYTTFCAMLDPAGHGDKFTEWTFSVCPKGNDDYTEGESP
jgi:hypothetical protein